MALHTQHITNKWTDDYLDLLNYAKSIGDLKWQNDIIEKLKQRDTHIQQAAQQMNKQELWNRFAAINRKMTELFAQIRAAVNSSEQRALQEQIWQLKLQRVEIGKELRTV